MRTAHIAILGSSLAFLQSFALPPEVTNLTITPNSTISWTSISGEVYQVQTTEDLLHPAWNNINMPETAQSNSSALVDFSIEKQRGVFRILQKEKRNDGAYKLTLPVSGSLQNPAWSPDGKALLFTRFRTGYNEGPADMMLLNLQSNTVTTLVTNMDDNINLPGSVWNATTHKIVFASTRGEHDEIYLIDETGSLGSEVQITSRPNHVAYEPALSSNGQWTVFESHILDVETNGIIIKYKTDQTSAYLPLTGANEDCRQPNWSPTDNAILYQKLVAGQWDLWVVATNGTGHLKLTSGSGDKTDASFSPDGLALVYSSDEGGLGSANLFTVPTTGGASTRITFFPGYDGAPSWSPDKKRVAFESFPTDDPDGSTGTTLWIKDLPSP